MNSNIWLNSNRLYCSSELTSCERSRCCAVSISKHILIILFSISFPSKRGVFEMEVVWVLRVQIHVVKHVYKTEVQMWWSQPIVCTTDDIPQQCPSSRCKCCVCKSEKAIDVLWENVNKKGFPSLLSAARCPELLCYLLLWISHQRLPFWLLIYSWAERWFLLPIHRLRFEDSPLRVIFVPIHGQRMWRAFPKKESYVCDVATGLLHFFAWETLRTLGYMTDASTT